MFEDSNHLLKTKMEKINLLVDRAFSWRHLKLAQFHVIHRLLSCPYSFSNLKTAGPKLKLQLHSSKLRNSNDYLFSAAT